MSWLPACLLSGSRCGGIYRPLRNSLLNDFQEYGVGDVYSPGMIKRDNLRAMIRYLRASEVLWYAPDQDFGPDRSEFAPFFWNPHCHRPAACSTWPVWAMPSWCPCIPSKMKPTGRITVTIRPAFDHFPSSDPVDDLTRFQRLSRTPHPARPLAQ